MCSASRLARTPLRARSVAAIIAPAIKAAPDCQNDNMDCCSQRTLTAFTVCPRLSSMSRPRRLLVLSARYNASPIDSLEVKLARLFDFTLDRKEGHCSQWIVLDYSRCLQRSEREEGSLHIVADSALLVARFTVTFVLAARRSFIIAGFACVRLLACLSSLVRCEHMACSQAAALLLKTTIPLTTYLRFPYPK